MKRFAVLTRFAVEHYNVAALVGRGTVKLRLALCSAGQQFSAMMGTT
jgi:hypothetical protein